MGDMNDLRGMAMATRAAALADRQERMRGAERHMLRNAAPVIPGISAPGSLAKGAALGAPLTSAGRRRRGLVAAMLSHLPPDTMKTLTPQQRAALAEFGRLDGGGR